MDKKILIICILAAVLMILLPISSVVGINVIKSNGEKKVSSPLFAIRNKSDNLVKSKFLGKETKLNIFHSKISSLQTYVDKSFKLIENNPNIIKSILISINQMPEIENLMKQNNIDMEVFKEEINLIINDNDLLKDKVDEALLISPFKEDPVPLGLSTSSALGCFIVALILAPIFVLIGAIIATITIITCLNINGCFENLVESIFNSFVQGLVPPEY